MNKRGKSDKVVCEGPPGCRMTQYAPRRNRLKLHAVCRRSVRQFGLPTKALVAGSLTCVVRRYGLTRGTEYSSAKRSCSRPLLTIHQPTPPCAAPRPSIVSRRGHRPCGMRLRTAKYASGPAKAMPMARPQKRCSHSIM